MQGVILFALLQVVCEVGKAVGAEGLVAGQIVDIKSEGMAEQVTCMHLTLECTASCQTRTVWEHNGPHLLCTRIIVRMPHGSL